jgi:hypothetical protein
MRAYYDTEFIQRRKGRSVLASIAIVRDDGQELYMVSDECAPCIGGNDWWFKKNVWKYIKDHAKAPLTHISEAVQEFLIPCSQIVTRSGQTDLELLEKLVGPIWFAHLDVQPIWESVGRPALPAREDKHIALGDARFHRSIFHTLLTLGLDFSAMGMTLINSFTERV